jgi:hypothetical protein
MALPGCIQFRRIVRLLFYKIMPGINHPARVGRMGNFAFRSYGSESLWWPGFTANVRLGLSEESQMGE